MTAEQFTEKTAAVFDEADRAHLEHPDRQTDVQLTFQRTADGWELTGTQIGCHLPSAYETA